MLLAWTLGFALLGSLGAILGPGIATIAFFRLGH